MEQTDYLADSFPVYWPNLGPELCATPFGCELEFSETTNWSIPIVHAPDDWNRIIETACDFWCMVSPQMARDMILPDILTEMQPLERSLFHLDGPQALPHLDLLLEIPHLNAIQWVYGAGNGPAAKWIDVYRRIRHAGKAIQLLAETPDDALTVLDAIGPKGVWICLAIPTLSQAQAFITQIEKPHS